MLMQQLWLICGSLQAVRQASVLRWDRKDLGKGVLIGWPVCCNRSDQFDNYQLLAPGFFRGAGAAVADAEQTGVQMLLASKMQLSFG